MLNEMSDRKSNNCMLLYVEFKHKTNVCNKTDAHSQIYVILVLPVRTEAGEGSQDRSMQLVFKLLYTKHTTDKQPDILNGTGIIANVCVGNLMEV